MIYSRKTLLTAFFALLLVKSAFAANAILNHTATLGANGFACDNGKLYVASSGGLYCRNQLTGVGTLFNNSAVFPDPALTAIALDASGVLWMGSQNGYLYKREKNGLQIVVTAYAAAGWPITSIMAYGRYIIIGSEKGCSVLDAAKLVVLKNATEFSATVPGSRVNAITVFRDTLLLGCDLGVVKLYAAGSRLSDANFYDPSIWSIDSSMSRPVRAFTVRASGYRVFDTPGAMLGESIFTGRPEGDSSALFINGNRSLGLSSRVTCMTIDSIRKTCLIGTKLHYFYEWDGTHLLSDNIQGPTFTTVLRVFVDHRSDLWACPEIGAGTTNPWWEGISVYTNNAWTLHSPLNSPGMGSITGNNIFRGVAEDRMGNMWFGTPFGGVKRYDREKKSWSQYSVSERSNGPQFVKAGNVAYRGKCDAVARDSAGFLWMASWENYSGCLIGYDPDFEPVPSATTPQTRHYKRFWPQEHPYYSENITCLNVDKANNIFAGSDQNK
ncbi:MAG: hypothetical protein MUF22_07915, partial [Chitinispirillaceae bacterium]|nr:hypothetical protein [Chitinispirillaceae bacterium]